MRWMRSGDGTSVWPHVFVNYNASLSDAESFSGKWTSSQVNKVRNRKCI